MHDLLLGCRLAACARWIDELAAPCGVRGLISPAVTIASTLSLSLLLHSCHRPRRPTYHPEVVFVVIACPLPTHLEGDTAFELRYAYPV